MKKTIILLLVFLLLGGTAWYMSKGSESKKMTILKEERAFHVEDVDQIQKVFLADRRNNQTTLERKGDHWIVEGKHRVRKNVMDNLLDAIKRVRIRFTPPNAAYDNIVKNLASEGIKVEIYGAEDQLIKSYYVGGMTNDEFGTYMIMDGHDNPFVTHIPNWGGGLRARYQITGDDWRDRAVFRETPKNIEEIIVDYPRQKSQSFVIKRTGASGFDVSPLHETTPVITTKAKKGKIEAFLYGLENLQGETIVNHLDTRDSISALLPFTKVTVKHKDGSSKAAAFHPIVLYRGGATVKEGEKSARPTAEVERYHVNISNGDFILGQHRNFEKIFWGYSQFF